MARLYLIGLLVFLIFTAVANGEVEELDDYDESWDTDRSSCSDEYSDSSEESPSELICGPNESINKCPIDCPSDYCPRSEVESKQTLFCPQPKVCPPPKCKCNFNHRRAKNGTCIPTQNCPPFRCSGPNEEFNACPPLCPSDDCSQASPTGKCPIIGRIGIVLICNPKCRCKKGYWRKNGKCVPYAQCSKCTKPHEFFTCGPECDNECKTLGIQNRTNCPIINVKCNEKCYCEDGYARDDKGNCIPVDQCCNHPNEEYILSGACPPDLCASISHRYYCPKITLQYRCRCKSGFLRQNTGSPCIPINECKNSKK